MIDRICPICNGIRREEVYSYTLTNGLVQSIYSCSCGMIYSTNPQTVDYAQTTIYTAPNAIGSGSTEPDRLRLRGIVDALEQSGIPKTVSILDIGCSQGGLLVELAERGYKNAEGIDPSIECVSIASHRGLKVTHGDLSSLGGKYDVIILSHVLEHIDNLQQAFDGIINRLKPSGRVYLEVPDAGRYGHYGLPFLDFNSEHINHFDACSLKKALETAGLFGGMVQEKTIQLTNGSAYPAIWILASRSKTVMNMDKFVIKSMSSLAQAEVKMLRRLEGFPHVIVWGAGEYLSHVLPLLRTKQIMQIVDRNPALWGKVIDGIKVESTESIKSNAPIVIAAIVAAESIKKDIEKMGLKNIVVPLEVA